MHSSQLHEHDANQGAQSKGEFLGMTGNSAWYLLAAAGASIMLVIVLWGMLGLSLLVCIALGLLLCGLSVAYVFGLKNNRPEHFDTDFFESALIEAGMLELVFGPRERRPPNPFRAGTAIDSDAVTTSDRRHTVVRPALAESRSRGLAPAPTAANEERPRGSKRTGEEEVPTIPLVAYERVQSELAAAEEMLEEAIAAREDDVCA